MDKINNFIRHIPYLILIYAGIKYEISYKILTFQLNEAYYNLCLQNYGINKFNLKIQPYFADATLHV